MKAKLFLLFFGLLGFVVQAAAKEKIYVNSGRQDIKFYNKLIYYIL